MPKYRHTVCVVDDDDNVRELVRDLLESEGHDVQAFGSAEAFLDAKVDASCLILDNHMPGLTGLELQRKLNEDNRHVAIIFMTAQGDVPSTVQAIKAGALEFFQKPFDPDALLQAVARAVQMSAMGQRTAEIVEHDLGIIGQSRSLRGVLEEVAVVARTNATVLIRGETGTGKELIAQAIHVMSKRTGPLVRMNCAAVPANLLESELMGHEKGAFTGAQTRRVGRFEAANEGTLFLDEIGELPLDLQPKMLRLLQERAFERLGSNQTITSTARIVAATNRDLRVMAEERTFREDLYHRLNVFPIELPPLRDRSEDIPVLARHFADHFASRMEKPVPVMSVEFVDRLLTYKWPGNIRELMNVMERASILATDGVLPTRALNQLKNPTATVSIPVTPQVSIASVHAEAPRPPAPADGDRLEDIDRRHILAVLESTNWIVGGSRGAAARLGIKRPTLIYRMKKLGIVRARRED
jgi:DNA-binding NtrC family response regulator